MQTTNTSPTRLAWKRLQSHKLAMIGLGLVLCVCFACVFAPLLSSQDPTRQQAWVGALPPGSSSLITRAHMSFTVGETPQAPPLYSQCNQLELSYTQDTSIEYRITCTSRGKIREIQQVHGAIILREIDFREGTLRDQSHPERTLAAIQLKRRKAAPDNFFTDAQRNGKEALLVHHILGSSQYDVTITLTEGLVTTITQNNTILNHLEITGDSLNACHGDGQSLSQTHLLGTDQAGRDLFSRILHGGRISLLVGLVATAVSLCIGVCYGAIAGYCGGRVDRLMMAATDILYAIPFMFLVILLLVMFGRNLIMLFVALGAVSWLTMARIVRGQMLTLKQREFVEAARICGASHTAIIFKHLLPNCIGPIIVYATLTVPAVILEESFLAFIGLQVQWDGQSLDSWGALVQIGQSEMSKSTGDKWWLLVWPSLIMALTLLSLNALGDGLRDALDPEGEQ